MAMRYGNKVKLSVCPKAKVAQKNLIPVQVEFAQFDGICTTKEGEVSYKSGDAILIGIEGGAVAD